MAINPAKLFLKQGKTALLVCDIQSKFSKATFEFDKMAANTARLIKGCKLLNVPVIVTKQYPTALGPTVPEFDISEAKGPFAKTDFDMCTPEINTCKLLNIPMNGTEQNPTTLGSTVSELDISRAKDSFAKTPFNMCTPEVKEALLKICSGGPPDTVLLAGLEAHVSVEITATELRSEGFNVHAVVDCISSRSPEDRFYAFDRMKDIGCVLATSENVVLKLIGRSDHPQFKTILRLIRPHSGQTAMSSSSKL